MIITMEVQPIMKLINEVIDKYLEKQSFLKSSVVEEVCSLIGISHGNAPYRRTPDGRTFDLGNIELEYVKSLVKRGLKRRDTHRVIINIDLDGTSCRLWLHRDKATGDQLIEFGNYVIKTKGEPSIEEGKWFIDLGKKRNREPPIREAAE